MSRTLTVLLRRDPSQDRQKERVRYLGIRPLWPDGRPVNVGLDVFCQVGQRLLGLNRLLAHRQECLIQLICLPVTSRDQDMHRLPGHRVRRFYLERRGLAGRIHFLDGTPTDVQFQIGQDELEVLRWIGLPYLRDGEIQWFDLAAAPAESTLGLPPGDNCGDLAEKPFGRTGSHTAPVVQPVAG